MQIGLHSPRFGTPSSIQAQVHVSLCNQFLTCPTSRKCAVRMRVKLIMARTKVLGCWIVFCPLALLFSSYRPLNDPYSADHPGMSDHWPEKKNRLPYIPSSSSSSSSSRSSSSSSLLLSLSFSESNLGWLDLMTRLMEDTLGADVRSHTPSFRSLSRISQLNNPGFSLFSSRIRSSTTGVATRGLLPPIAPGRMLPVS